MALLEVSGLRRPGLHPVTFSLDAGECVAVRGPSGSGKTLLLRALADLDPSAGSVSLDGTPREALPAPDWRRRVAYLPSESGWWSERVGDHFARWSAAAALVERLRLPAESRDWSVARLSTGERQRLALVRLLTLDPRVLLLDEPTSGLDEDATAAVEDLVRKRLDAGAGALVVSHDAAQSRRLARRALRVSEGRVTEDTP